MQVTGVIIEDNVTLKVKVISRQSINGDAGVLETSEPSSTLGGGTILHAEIA